MRLKFTMLLASLFSVFVLSGCAGLPYGTGPSGTMPAWVYADDQVYPSANTSSTQYQLTTDDFDIAGTVVATGESENILGIISRGDNGYQSLLQEAQGQGYDDVINVRVDTRFTNILFVYTKVQTVLVGHGVNWR